MEDRRRLSPQEKRFRRGLYVMLVVIGLLAAGSVLDARNTHNELAAQRAANASLRAALAELAANQARLIEMEQASGAAATARAAAASAERARLLARDAQLEHFILILLQRRGVLAPGTYTVSPAPGSSANPSPAPAPGGSPGAQSTAKPTPRPSPTPTASPTCLAIARVNLCVTALNVRDSG